MRRITAIETSRLRLRPYVDGDLDALHRLWTDPDVRRYLWDDQLIDRATAEETMRDGMRSTDEQGFGHWAACPPDSDVLIGFCGLKSMPEPGEVELLYGFLPAYWKRGLATEAGRAMLRFAFEQHGKPRVYAITDTPNVASAAVMQRLGMRFEKRWDYNGLDSVRYVITREEFIPGDGPYRLV